MIEITIGVPTLNRYDFLIKTIEYVLTQKHPAVCEIIVVDQSDDDVIQPSERDKLKNWNDSSYITWLKLKRKNLPAARNLILQKAKGEIILFLDDDVIIPPNFIKAHYKHYNNSNELVAVAGLNYDRLNQIPAEIINFDNYKTYTHKRKGFENYSDSFSDFIGANHSISKKLACIEGYDESYIGYGEDTDMAKRILKLKMGRIICDPDAWVIHLKVPAGGCRVTDSKIKRREIEIVGPFLLYAFRHLKGKERLKVIKNSLRVGPLRKENVIKIWRQFYVWFQYLYSLIWAYRNMYRVKSPFLLISIIISKILLNELP